jgi:hypothetical protein
MKIAMRWLLVTILVSLATLLLATFRAPVVQGASDHVRWDIVHLNPATTPPTLGPGGVTFAYARNPSALTITLTGSGTFQPGDPGAVTGGGTWETFNGNTSTGSGSYEVTGLVFWRLGSLQTGSFIDLIDDGARANGTAILRIRYSDGTEGVLNIGCHGPGAPDGILEGVITTKDYVTYWDAQAPVGGVDADRTVFHIAEPSSASD